MNPLRQVEPFKTFLESFKSERTSEGYACDLNGWKVWLNDRGKTWAQATQEDCEVWVRWCKAEELVDRTITRKIAAISGLYRWLLFKKRIKEDPTLTFKYMDFDKGTRNPKPLTPIQRETLLKCLKFDSLRNWRKSMLTLIAYYTGMRINEIRKMKWSDINFDTFEIQTVGKGAKSMTKQFNETLKAKLNDFKTVQKKESDYLFYAYGNVLNPVDNRLISGWSQTVKEWAGFPKEFHYTCHVLRHDFCNRLMEGGIPLEETQELMGHSNVATTLMYYKARQEKIKAAYHKAI